MLARDHGEICQAIHAEFYSGPFTDMLYCKFQMLLAKQSLQNFCQI